MRVILQDICNEASAYQYSKEFFNLYKECSELDVIQQYVDSQHFIQENAEYVESMNQSSAGYMMESAATDEISVLEESIKERAQKIWSTIVERGKALLKGMMSVINKLIDCAKKALSERTRVRNHLQKHLELVPKAAEVADKARLNNSLVFNTDKSRVSMSKKDPVMKADKLFNNVNNRATLMLSLSAAVNDDDIYVDRDGCVNSADIEEVFERYFRPNRNSKNPNDRSNSSFLNTMHETNTPAVYVDEHKLTRLNQNLSKLSEQLMKDTVDADKLDFDGYSSAAEYSKAVAIMNKWISNDIRLFADIIKFRNDSLKGIAELIKNTKKDKNGSTNSAGSFADNDEDTE